MIPLGERSEEAPNGPPRAIPAGHAGLASRVLGGSAWSIGAQGTALLTSFIVTPFVIRFLGTEDYGIWTLLNLVIAYLGFADLGMGAATTIFGSEAVAKDDQRGESAVIWTSVAITAFPVAGFAALLWIAGPTILDVGFALPLEKQAVAAVALKLATVALVATAFSGIFNTPQLARMKIGTNSGITVFGYLAQSCLILLTLRFGGRLLAVVGVMTAVAVLTAGLNFVFSARLSPGMLRPAFDRHLTRPLVRFGIAVVASAVIGTIIIHGEKFLLARLASVSSLAHYNVALTLAGLLGIAPAAISVPLAPALVRLRVGKETGRMERTYNRILRGLIIFTLPAALVLYASGRTVITLWAGTEFGKESTFPFYILLAGWLFHAASYLPRCLLAAWNRVEITTRIQAFEVIPYFIVVWVLIDRFGINGAAAAWALRVAVECLALLRYAGRVAGVKTAPFKGSRGVFSRAITVLIAPPLLIGGFSPTRIVLFLSIGASLAAYAYLTYTRLIDEDERTWIRGLLARFINVSMGAGRPR